MAEEESKFGFHAEEVENALQKQIQETFWSLCPGPDDHCAICGQFRR